MQSEPPTAAGLLGSLPFTQEITGSNPAGVLVTSRVEKVRGRLRRARSDWIRGRG